MSNCLEQFFQHNRWANLQIIDTCAPLTDTQLDTVVPGTYGSIRATLVHMIGSEARYVARLRGETPSDFDHWNSEFPGFPALRATAAQSGAALIDLAADAQCSTVLRYVAREGDAVAIPTGIFLVQVVNHATEHRSQIATALTQLGFQPDELSGWGYAEATGQL